MSVEGPGIDGDRAEPRKGRGCLGTALIGVAILLVVLGLLVGVFFLNNRPPHIVIPTPRMPKPNAWHDFVRAAKYIKVFGPYSTVKPPTDWTRTELEHFMRSDAQCIAMLRRGLSKPYRHPPVRGYDFPYFYAPFRELARTLSGAAYYYEWKGEPGKAIEAQLDCIEFGAIMPRGGPLVASLVAIAVQSIGANHIGRVLPKLSPADLKRAAARLEVIRSKQVSFAEMMAEEADTTASYLVAAMRDPKLQRRIRSPLAWVRERDPYGMLWQENKKKPGASRAWANMRFAFGSKTKMIREIHDYYIAAGIDQNRAYTGESRVPEPASYSAEGGIGDLSRARAVFAASEADLNLIQVEVALRRYKADNGRYPARLTQLRPKYLRAIPYDPFGGKSFRYRVLKNGPDFLLYSIGQDLTDNGGKGAQHLGNAPGDIVLDR